MNIITSLYASINAIEARRFYYYLIAFLALTTLISTGIIVQYYRSISALKKEVKRVNEYRRQAQDILTRAQEVDHQRLEVNTLLMQDPNFKIGGYFKEILAALNLTQKKKMETTQTLERNDDYIEHTLNAQLVDINMKDLTILLERIENNPRIFTRDLEIKRSEKIPGTIDVTLVIATLLPTTTTTA